MLKSCLFCLFCSNQSVFKKTDSCVNQLLSIVHKIYKSFDKFLLLETRSEFFDISEALAKVWHEGLIYQLTTICVSDILLTLLQSLLNNRYQRVSLNGQNFLWTLIKAEIQQRPFHSMFLSCHVRVLRVNPHSIVA